MQHDLAKSETTHIHQHINRCKATSKSTSQPLSSSKLFTANHSLFFFIPKYKIPFQQKGKVCAAAHDFVVYGITVDYCSQLKERACNHM